MAASYPRQLITALCSSLDKRLVDFFDIEHKRVFWEYTDINEFISDTLWQYIKNATQKAEIIQVNILQVRMRRQKKKRWISSYETNMAKYDLSDKKNPFHIIWSNDTQLLGSIFTKMYNAPDAETAIENYKLQIQEWKSDDKSLLIDFPLLFTKTKHQVQESFRCDLIINLIEIINSEFDGDLESFFSKRPELLMDQPLFSPTRYSVPFQESLNSYVADLVDFDRDNLILQMLVLNDPNETKPPEKFKVFDPKDNKILMALINSINLDFYESKQITMEVGAIAKKVNSRPNKALYEDVKLRLHNMASIGFRLYRKDNPNVPIFTFTFLDNVQNIEQNGKEYVAVTFGQALFESITKKKMISVTSSNYNSLENEMSQLLYHNLQRERIILSHSSVPNEEGYLYKTYDYSFFQRIILFKRRRKAENIRQISIALQEFVDKQIALVNFSYNKEQELFHLYYYPLTEDEAADLIRKEDDSDDTELIGASDVPNGDSSGNEVIVQTSLF